MRVQRSHYQARRYSQGKGTMSKNHNKFYEVKLLLRGVVSNYNSNGFNEWDELDFAEKMPIIENEIDKTILNKFREYIINRL